MAALILMHQNRPVIGLVLFVTGFMLMYKNKK